MFVNDGGSTGLIGAGSYGEGETVTVSAGTREGFVFAGWTAEGVTLDDSSCESVMFIMPAQDVTLTVAWEKAVVQVGSDYFLDIQLAFSNAAALTCGGTVELLEDVTVTGLSRCPRGTSP